MTDAIPGSPHPRAPWRPIHLLVLGCLALLGLGAGWAGRERELLVFGDESVYVTLSQSLAEGRYHDEYLVDRPRHVHYPPGMPALLLGLRLIGGGAPDVARAVNLLLVVVTVLLIADLVRRISTPWTGVVAGGLTAVNTLILYRAGTLYAETLFMALAILAIWAAQRFREDGRRRWVLLSLLAGLGGFLTRLAGVAVLGGIWTAWVTRRAWRTALATGLIMAATAGSWMAYTTIASRGSVARSYGDDFAARRAAPELGEVARVAGNTWTYAVNELPSALDVPTMPGTPLDNLVVLAVLGSLGLVGVGLMLRNAPAAALTLLAYSGMLCVWVWPNARFLTPMLPAFLGMLAVGAHGIGTRLGRLAPLPIILLVALTGVPGFVQQLSTIGSMEPCDTSRPSDPTACFPAEHRGYVAVAWFARDHLPANAVLIGERAPMTYYLSGLRSLPGRLLPRTAAVNDLEPLLARGATHLLLGPARVEDTRSRLARAALDGCTRFTTLAAFPGAILLGVRAAGAAGGDACSGLTDYLAGIDRLPPGSSPSPDAAP